MNGLDQIRRTAKFIEEYTGGKQRFISGIGGAPFIKSDDSVNIRLQMRKKPHNEAYTVYFSAFVQRMNVEMDTRKMQSLATETQRIANLLLALDTEPIVLTEDDYRQWADEIAEAEALEEAQEISPIMGM